MEVPVCWEADGYVLARRVDAALLVSKARRRNAASADPAVFQRAGSFTTAC